MDHFPQGIEELGLSADDCERMRQELGDDEFRKMLFQQGISLGKKALVETLLDSGVSVEAPWFSRGATALLSAAGGDEDLVRLLLERGASPNVEDSEGVTPLGNAIRERNIENVLLLLEYGADPWYCIPWSDLRETAGEVRTEIIVQMLLQATAQHEDDD